MKFIKRAVSIITTLTICSSLCCSVFAAEYEKEVTMGQLEDEMVEYVEKTYPEIEYGTEEYINFLSEQLMGDTDENIVDKENYYDLMLYANQYIYELDKVQLLLDEGDIFEYPESERDLTPSEVRERADSREAEYISKHEEKDHNVMQISNSYDADAAADYALEWCEGRNPEYNSHLKDCTNFVSQCLVAGGIDMEYPRTIPNGIYDTTSYWYSTWYYEGSVRMYNESSSFIGVQALCDYLEDNGICYDTMISTAAGLDDVQDEASIGDIIQLKYAGGDYSHSIIITGGRKGNLRYSGHTNNRNNVKLSTLEDTGISRYRTIFLS